MSLYEVTRNDEVKPGEFVSGYVIASGKNLARLAVGHMYGVTLHNVDAVKVDTVKTTKVLSAYFDERDEFSADQGPAPVTVDGDAAWGDAEFIGKVDAATLDA